eukprot:4286464-Karenia_brevis.AAC.1
MMGQGTHCLLCGPEEGLEQALASPNGVQTWANKLKQMSPQVMNTALNTRIPHAWRGKLQRAMEAAEAASRYCQGRPDEPCTFAISKKPGKFQMMGRGTHCLLCGPEEALEQALASPNGAHTLASKLKKMSPDTIRAAVDTRIPQRWREEVRSLLPLDAPKTWAAIQDGRQSCTGNFSAYEDKQYRKRKLDDR